MPPVPPLSWDNRLQQAAQRHAKDMAQQGFFSHQGSDDSNVSTRARDAGFAWKNIGENIAYNYPDAAAVVAGWQTQETTARLQAQAQDLVAEVAAGTDFEALGLPVTREAALTRQDFVPEVPRTLLQQAFTMQPGDLAVVEAPAQAYLLRLDAILPPDMANEAVTELAARLQAEADQAMTEDLFRALAVNIQERVGITLDQAAINAVHANFQ